MTKRTMSTRVEVDREDATAMMRAYARHAADVKRETEYAALRHARALVPQVQRAAAARGRQAALAAQSVRLTSTSPPTLSAGGSVVLHPHRTGRLPHGGDLFFGTEFGGSLNKQFPPRTRQGWWYLPTVTAGMGKLRRAYGDALERAARRWGSGG